MVSKIIQKITASHFLIALVFVVAGAGILGVVIFVQAKPSPSKQRPDHTDTTKTVTRHASSTSKPGKPKPKPKAATSTSKTKSTTKSTAPAKPVATKSSAKPKTVVSTPGSSVSSLKPKSTKSSGGSKGSGSGSGSGSSPPATTSYTSTNWSGYLATTGSFSGISATWTVPQSTGTGYSLSADATWIGIGGVTANDLIQVGTDNAVTASGQVSTSAFFEILPAAAEQINSITVTPGDTMQASLTEPSAGQWVVSITDESDGNSFTTNVSYASSNSSAEWIEEDPSYGSGRLIPLDDFGTVSFSDGSTTMNGSAVSIAGSDPATVTLVNSAGQSLATPSALGGDGASFSITRSGL